MRDPHNRHFFTRTGTAAFCLGCILYLPSTQPLHAQAQAALSDAEIESSVTQAIQSAPQLQSQAITAATISGEVTLSGVVADNSTKQAAEHIVSAIQGVRAVHDNLTIGNPAAVQTDQSAPPVDQQGSPQMSVPEQPAPGPAPSAPAPPQGAPAAQIPPPPPVESTTAPAPYGDDQGYRPPYNGNQAAYAPTYSQQQQQQPSGPVTIPAGTLLRIRTSEPLDVRQVQSGSMFEATAAADIYEGSVIAIPRGATVEGEVVDAKASGAFGGKPELALKLTTLNLEGRVYPLASDVWSSQGASKSGYTATNTAGGALVGALLGAFLGGGPGAAFGAVAGGVGGATVSGATAGPRMVLPPEAVLNFHLSAPVTVQPVSYEEAQRLASSVPQQQQPQLRRRPVYMAAPPPYYYSYYPMYYGRFW
ncbi:MAG: BON domain-containing protein [Acidobacteria bacterium]|nr:BON domain-containing protein [Acidobacteriota bacterium]MBW4044735.1 BON domain-containing protein [Acidobacteriota bacterium]